MKQGKDQNEQENQDLAWELLQEQKIKKFRSIVLKDAQYIGIYNPQNWKSFNDFMLLKSPLKKPLKDYTIDEFEALTKQFKSMKSKYQRESKIEGTWAWHHKNKLPFPSDN